MDQAAQGWVGGSEVACFEIGSSGGAGVGGGAVASAATKGRTYVESTTALSEGKCARLKGERRTRAGRRERIERVRRDLRPEDKRGDRVLAKASNQSLWRQRKGENN